jgi:hypothetical protein
LSSFDSAVLGLWPMLNNFSRITIERKRRSRI